MFNALMANLRWLHAEVSSEFGADTNAWVMQSLILEDNKLRG